MDIPCHVPLSERNTSNIGVMAKKNKCKDGWSMTQHEICEVQITEQDDIDDEDEPGYESSKDALKEVKGVE